MVRVDTVRSVALTANEVGTIRRLLDRAFGGDFSDEDWTHAVGGHHVLVRRRDRLVAHASVVPRTLWIGSELHEVGYVEAVATAPAAQGMGFGTLVMEAIGRVIAREHEIGVLSTGQRDFYERLGWQRWRGPTSVKLACGEIVRTPDDDDGVMVLSAARLDLDASITCHERAGDDW